MKQQSTSWQIISWTLGLLFVLLSILYLIYIHPTPAAIYLVLSLLYLPPVVKVVKRTTGLSISPILLLLLAFLVLWYTLAVGELIEYFE